MNGEKNKMTEEIKEPTELEQQFADYVAQVKEARKIIDSFHVHPKDKHAIIDNLPLLIIFQRELIDRLDVLIDLIARTNNVEPLKRGRGRPKKG